jgi:hypothetical protein
MADAGIKKVTIPNADLPIANNQVGGYAVRYRIVSDDKNRISHWSPTYYIDAQYTYVNGNISTPTKTGNVLSVAWDKVEIKKDATSIGKIRDYEVWVRWDKGDGGDWAYDGKSQTNNISFVIPTTYLKSGVEQSQAPNRFSIEIYLESVPVARTTGDLLRYSVTNHTV